MTSETCNVREETSIFEMLNTLGLIDWLVKAAYGEVVKAAVE